MTIKEILIKYSKELEEISSTPRLDVETLLQKVLGVDRLYILLNLERNLSEEEENLFNKFIEERLNNRPIAYIVGNREFMGLDFYRAITKQAKNYLKKGGILAYEVGHDQSKDVSKLMEMDGYTNIYTLKDLQQIDRVVIGTVL